MTVCYTHSNNLHSLAGAKEAVSILFSDHIPESVIDVGCGTGSWLRAASEAGVAKIYGVNGVVPPDEELHIEKDLIISADLTLPFELNEKFEVAFCLEVAEHLDETSSAQLVKTITQLSDQIYFSAAIPNQPGDHHVNCQWPSYWQCLFNSQGFECKDTIRPQIWESPNVEPWYRQNMFLAIRSARAGTEPRLQSLIHEEMLPFLERTAIKKTRLEQTTLIEQGRMPVSWYILTPFKAIFAKVIRAIRRQ